MKKKIFVILWVTISLLCHTVCIAEENDIVKDTLNEGLGFDEYLSSMESYIQESGLEDIDIAGMAEDLVSDKGVDYQNLLVKVISFFSKELLSTLKSAGSIFMILIIISLLSALDLENKGDITKIAQFVCFITIATITLVNFMEVMQMFKNVVSVLTTIMQIVSPFLMSLLIATGAITTTGMIQPLLLFLASFIGFLVNYVIFPLFTISVIFNIISTISENTKFHKMSKFFNSAAIWIVGVCLTLFLGVLSMEGSISSSVDSLAVKTTQSAVSNFVPVVGKFFTDSFETVVGATKIIGKVGGNIGIIAIVLVSAVPILKILSIVCVYKLLVALAEPICHDEGMMKYLDHFANLYKNLLGILIGIVILFVISSGITLNLVSMVIK